MSDDRNLRLAFNKWMIDKNESREEVLYSHGWIEGAVPLGAIALAVTYGWAFCPVMADGLRSAKNFVASDIVAVDVDETPSVEHVLAHPLVQEHGGFVYTTVSHSDAEPRLRVVFELPRTITKGTEFAALLRGLSLRLAGDPRATDAARISFGNRAAEVHLIERQLSCELLEELIAQGLSCQHRDGGPGSSARSKLRIPEGIEVTRADGFAERLELIAKSTRVHCPYHDDKHPSAFVVTSRSGVNGIHCSTCMQTFWPDGSAADDYEFDDFEREAVRAREFFEKHHDGGPLFASDPDAISGLTGCNIILTANRSVPHELSPGVTFIRSPKGTGKTTGLQALLSGEKKVLLIGHRRALISQSCKQLGLTCYLDEVLTRNDRHELLGVCLDSLHKVSPKTRYDVIVIDESEQVLGHFLSETMDRREGVGRERLFVELRDRVQKAKKVVALDADLGWTTFHTLSRMVLGRSSGRHG
jgi:hypothetical protein